ncbi:methyl-accepting chemotaxis protein, partial [Halarcobacter ebronensis]
MITGYEELNQNINLTIEKIEQVANASKEQEAGIVQINDAVNLLDRATQENAQVADQISKMSSDIANMSDSLVTAASRASFLQEAREEVCNVDLVYDTAKLKVNVLGLKDDVYSKLGSYEKWTTSSCYTVSDWIKEYLEINPSCDYSAIEDLEKLNVSLKGKLQELV